MTTDQINTNEYHPYYQLYIDKAKSMDLVNGLKASGEEMARFLKAIPEDKHEYQYANGKWTVKELLQHVIDTERVFAYRALCIARNDKTALPGYDQDVYNSFSDANSRSYDDIVKEYEAVRMTSQLLFESFTNDKLLQIGNANGAAISVRALGFILIGHENHHRQIIEERYL
ncbi:DinB family protein [uncultured Psychroserpens sp.]|uniref:DinB family protein n=1 Tax=uncultured Psychroserpens sp. TaxID=255436 RepID=UPI002601BBC0|nr:DinB family protein [uncultured Psychroserpens sp.]